jgi:hypothetical protein
MATEITPEKAKLQLIWGAALLLAGIGVFFRIPQVMPQIREMTQLAAVSGFVKFCFYFMGVLLVGGGARKIYFSVQALQSKRPDA